MSSSDSKSSNDEGAGEAKPRILTVAVWVGELELAGQEGLGSVAGESQRYEGPLLNSFQPLWEA